jgi:hypothetical protein
LPRIGGRLGRGVQLGLDRLDLGPDELGDLLDQLLRPRGRFEAHHVSSVGCS